MAVTTAKARLNISIDADVKEQAGQILSEIGLDYTTAVNLYLRRIIAERAIPFKLESRQWKTPAELFGANWRDGLELIEDEWE